MGIILTWLRYILGTEQQQTAKIDRLSERITEVIRHLHRLEKHMSDAAAQIDALSAKVDAIAADVQILVNTDTSSLPQDAQDALDRLSAKLTDLQTEVGDQDGSDTPADPNA